MKKLNPTTTGKITRTPEEKATELSSLRPFAELVKLPQFELWKAGVDNAIETIQRAAWNDCSMGELRKALDALGISEKDLDHADPIVVFLAARSVVRFWHGTMSNLTQAHARYERLREELDARRKT